MAGFSFRVLGSWAILLLLSASFCTHASDFGNATNVGVRVIIDSDSQPDSRLKNDVLVMNAPNSKQVSYNRISLFNLTRPLKIINTADAYGVNSTQAANLIIIHADSISINSSIELVGHTADILLVSDNQAYSQLFCSCSFKNFGRVTLAHANPLLGANNLPGEMKLTSSGTIQISSLTTSGVASFEAIANKIHVNGKIDTQLKGVYASDGTYQISPNGGLIIGSGGVNLFAGFNIDYATLTLKQPLTNSLLSLPSYSNINTQAVHIAAASPIIVNGKINTRSDAVSTANYRGKVAAIPESIEIYGLHENAEIVVSGELATDGRVDIQSASKVTVNGAVKANIFDVTSASNFLNRGKAEFSEANIAAKSFENNGNLLGVRLLRVAVENELQNRFGGKLLASVIELSSKSGAVRNGSQYPFKSKEDIPMVLRPDAPNNIGLGTIDGIVYSGATKVSNLSASIVGRSITIDAAGNVENINPYFEYTPDSSAWANGIPFKHESASRVQLVAEDALRIGSNTFVLNSSATMGVNSPNGEFIIEAPYITNERYNTQAVIQPFTEQTISGNTTSTTTGTESALLVFSPPGVIYSFSPLGFYFTIKSGGFVNNTAYFEVLNNATFTSQRSESEPETAKVTSIGLMLQQQLSSNTTTTTVVRTQTVSECQAKAKDEASSRACVYNPSVTNYKNLTGTTEEIMQGTLFSVKGNISGAAADFYGTNHKVIEKLSNEQISAYITANTGQTGTFTNEQTGSTGNTLKATYAYTQTAQLSQDGKYIYVVKKGTLQSTSGTNSGSEADDRFLKSKEAARTTSVSVADFLKAKFAELKAALIAFYNAFMAWFA